MAISEVTGAPIYIVHLSSERALRVAEAAQARGVPVYRGDANPLRALDAGSGSSGRTATSIPATPPLREKRDKDAIWEGMREGHGPRASPPITSAITRADKMDPAVRRSVNNRPAGNYLQVNLPMLYSEGVRSRRITLEQIVALTATNPAKLFGLYPQKGTIAVGLGRRHGDLGSELEAEDP